MNHDYLIDLGPDEIIVPAAGIVRVGRGRNADVVLMHPTVGDPHASIYQTVGGMRLRDQSRGRTLVNGQRPRDVVALRPGDRVEFGAVMFQVVGSDRLCRQTSLTGLAIVSDNLGIARGPRRVLTAVRLSIRPGQFVGLLGASGAGKSTLLKCLAGYLPPAPGSSLRIDDLEIPRDLASYLPLIGYVPQEDVLFPGLTVTEGASFTALRLRAPDLGPVERNGLIRSVLQQVGVDDTAERLVATIAPGERKRVSVAQELLTRPRALFLDEPTTGLDPCRAKTQVMTYIALPFGRSRQGMPVVCATLVMENLTLFDRVLVIARGREAYDGAPSELLSTFRVRSYPDLYVQLEYESVVDKDSGNGLPGIASKSSVPVARLNAPPRSLRLSHQIAVQVLRGTKLIRRDVALLLLLLGQPVAIGLAHRSSAK